MSLYSGTVPQLTKMLKNLEGWLKKAEAHATARKFDANTLLQSRLAPDQYPLIRQIQSACDTAKFTASRISGKEAPKNPDTEQTLEEIRARIAGTIAFLDTVKEEDFKGGAEKLIPLGFAKGKGATGADYANEFALPNFYFHVVTAYAILRHNGTELGKMDYIGTMNLKDL